MSSNLKMKNASQDVMICLTDDSQLSNNTIGLIRLMHLEERSRRSKITLYLKIIGKGSLQKKVGKAYKRRLPITI